MRTDELPDLPASDTGLDGFGATKDEMRRGFKKLDQINRSDGFMTESNGDTYVGDRASFGGALGRPNGWER